MTAPPNESDPPREMPDSVTECFQEGCFTKFEDRKVFVHASGPELVGGRGVLIDHGYPGSVKMLNGSSVPANSQIWIYVNKTGTLKEPDEGHPIVQSYVEIVIIGSMELQTRVADPEFDFAEQFVKTTVGWSKHWVNDRLCPRRPYGQQPKAIEVDKRLQNLLPELVKAVRIE